MRLVIASDIHGSAFWCRRLMEAVEREAPDRLVLLGDLLYHGPRNALPRDYDPPQVAAMLNACADHIVAVRGNCDAEVDQMVLDFPCMGDYALIAEDAAEGFRTEGLEGGTPASASASAPEKAAAPEGSDEPQIAFPARGRTLFLTHGHVFGPDALPPHPAPGADGQVRFAVVSGHTHVKTNCVADGVLLVNPGSTSIPKDGSNSLMVYEDGAFRVVELTE